MKDDTISRATAIESVCTMLKNCFNATDEMLESVKITVGELPSAQTDNQINLCDSCDYSYPDCPSKNDDVIFGNGVGDDNICACNKYKPSAQPPKEIPKRVLWTGWKGCRDTRYKCPNCEKPVRNDDAYCHRCGQRLLFPNVSFTDYVPGQGHELIVRWDDEG